MVSWIRQETSLPSTTDLGQTHYRYSWEVWSNYDDEGVWLKPTQRQ
jgi:hypothetical protein